MQDDLVKVKVFCDEYIRQIGKVRNAQHLAQKTYKTELNKLAKERQNIIQAIKDGIPASALKEDLEKVTARSSELEALLKASSTEPKPFLHPAMAQSYRKKVKELRDALNVEATRGEAAELLRSLVERIVLTPKPGPEGLRIDLYGNLAGILKVATEDDTLLQQSHMLIEQVRMITTDRDDHSNPSVKVVAGAGCQRYLACWLPPLILDLNCRPQKAYFHNWAGYSQRPGTTRQLWQEADLIYGMSSEMQPKRSSNHLPSFSTSHRRNPFCEYESYNSNFGYTKIN